MGKWDKLIEKVLKLDKALRFDELEKILSKYGYTKNQPNGGGSHYTFRKTGCLPITIPKHTPINKAYIELVREIVKQNLEQED